jgi:hypothetical protein
MRAPQAARTRRNTIGPCGASENVSSGTNDKQAPRTDGPVAHSVKEES